MVTATGAREVAAPAPAGSPRASLFFKLLSGPVCFVLTYLLPIAGLPYNGKIVLATFTWAVMWWALQPVPWGVTSLLPLAIFPVAQAMSFAETTRLYGQPIFFWIWGFSLLGHAIIQHGLAKRFAVSFLRLPGIGTSTYRMLFGFMLVTGLLTWFVGHLSSIVMMLPLGLALQASLGGENGSSTRPGADARASLPDNHGSRNPRLGNFFAIGTLYASVAGGAATISGAPHNAVAVAQFEAITKQSLGWFKWMALGFPIFATSLIAFYLLLMLFFKPEFKNFGGSAELLREEHRKMGRMKLGEKYVLAIFLLGMALFVAPPFLPMILGAHHPVALWSKQVITTWYVPPVLMLMLFGIPTDIKKKEFVVNWKEGVARSPWHIIFLVTSGVGMTDALERFGFMKIITRTVLSARVGPSVFPFFAGTAGAFFGNVIHGVAGSTLLSSILIPIAAHPAATAIVIGATSVGMIFPWAGATVATAFSFGEISLKDLMRVGILATFVIILIAGGYALLIGCFL